MRCQSMFPLWSWAKKPGVLDTAPTSAAMLSNLQAMSASVTMMSGTSDFGNGMAVVGEQEEISKLPILGP